MLNNKIFEAGNKFRTSFGGTKKATKELKIQIKKCELVVKRNPKTDKNVELAHVIINHVGKGNEEKLIYALNAIPQESPQVFTARKHIVDDTVMNGEILLQVSAQRKALILNYTEKIKNAINNLKIYSRVWVDQLCVELYDQLCEVITSEDLETAKRRSINNWEDMLNKLSDPEVRKKLMRYQTTKNCEIKYGHILSPNNITQILDQNPNASFVAERKTWKDTFNRAIKPDAQAIIVKKPIGYNDLDYDSAARENGYDSYSAAKRDTNNSTQVLNQIKITANKLPKNRFINVKMYDVTDTIPPANPALDKWTNEIGLSDNITGILNQAAINVNKNLEARNKAEIEAEKTKENDAGLTSKWANRRKAIEMVCKRSKTDISKFENLSDKEFIVDATFYYAQKQAQKQAYVKEDDYNEIAALVTGAICVSCDTELPYHISKILPKKIETHFCQTAYTIVSGLLPQLNHYTRASNLNALQTESIKRNSLYLEYKNSQRKLKEAKYNMVNFIQENNLKNNDEENVSFINVNDFFNYCKNTLPKFE